MENSCLFEFEKISEIAIVKFHFIKNTFLCLAPSLFPFNFWFHGCDVVYNFSLKVVKNCRKAILPESQKLLELKSKLIQYRSNVMTTMKLD